MEIRLVQHSFLWAQIPMFTVAPKENVVQRAGSETERKRVNGPRGLFTSYSLCLPHELIGHIRRNMGWPNKLMGRDDFRQHACYFLADESSLRTYWKRKTNDRLKNTSWPIMFSFFQGPSRPLQQNSNKK